jgi:hypothetical protein
LRVFGTYPPWYSGNKISSFNGLRGGRRRKIFITKEFSAESRQQRTYENFGECPRIFSFPE